VRLIQRVFPGEKRASGGLVFLRTRALRYGYNGKESQARKGKRGGSRGDRVQGGQRRGKVPHPGVNGSLRGTTGEKSGPGKSNIRELGEKRLRWRKKVPQGERGEFR